MRIRYAKLALGIGLTIPILFIAMFRMDMRYRDYWLLALTTPVWLIVGWDFHRSALRNARHGAVNMDTLVSVGGSIAFVYSVVATFTGQDTFYDTAAIIITFIFLGKVLEALAKGRASSAIRTLMGLQAKTARVVRGGVEQDIPVAPGAPRRCADRAARREDSGGRHGARAAPRRWTSRCSPARACPSRSSRATR